jgi:hypothetical protein
MGHPEVWAGLPAMVIVVLLVGKVLLVLTVIAMLGI